MSKNKYSQKRKHTEIDEEAHGVLAKLKQEVKVGFTIYKFASIAIREKAERDYAELLKTA